jgi:hypothetical protein
MKRIFVFICAGIFLVSCATPKGVTKQDQRSYALKMKDETLADLYRTKPETKDMIKKAAGYGVFSNIGGYLFFLSTGGGYGVVVDNTTGRKTYMKMAQVGAGVSRISELFLFSRTKKCWTISWKRGGSSAHRLMPRQNQVKKVGLSAEKCTLRMTL